MGCGVSRQQTPNEALLKLRKDAPNQRDSVVVAEEFILTRDDTQVSIKDVTEYNGNDEMVYPVLTGAELTKMFRWVSDVEASREFRTPIPEYTEADYANDPEVEMDGINSIPS
eukprot:TRINITY_DN4022_c0_g1_i2.p1 TRINITY_DN4022_c0_g1~~TRINITY_DN4022_c0_g1_i2.p1  ORF type:complete len:113 (+),score=10.28 TRINITY_DN4022_c0_g1_i2:141-479(+)